jgi:streptogramin lyase
VLKLHKRLGLAFALLLSLAACSGGNGGAVPAGFRPPPTSGGSAAATLAIVIPAITRGPNSRRPKFVSAYTQSGLLTVNGSAPPRVLDLSSSGPGCTQGASSRTCTVAVDLPLGADTIAVETYDGGVANGQPTGKLLAKAQMTQTIAQGQVNQLVMSLLAVPSSVTLQLDNPTPPVGSAADVHLTANVYDPDGALITKDPYLTPVTVALDDTSGRVTLDKTTLSSPSDVITVHYGGKLLPAPANISLSSPVQNYPPGATVMFAPNPYTKFGQTTFPTVGGLATGPDGNLWFAECQSPSSMSTCKIASITMAGTIKEIANVTSAVQLGLGPDGNMWFTEGNRNFVGRVTPLGIVTEFPIPSRNPSTTAIIAGPDGRVWFTEPNNIGAITTLTGTISEYPLGGTFRPSCLVLGTDGNLWFSEGQQIGRVTTAGVVTQFSVDTSGYYSAGQLVFGPSNVMYFPNEAGSSNLWSMTTSGAVNKTAVLPAGYSVAPAPTRGPDGTIAGFGGDYNPSGYNQGGGLVTYDPVNGTTMLYLAVLPTPVHGTINPGPAVWGPDGNLWLGYDQGLLRFRYNP